MTPREQFRWDNPRCQWPGCTAWTCDVHEIARGVHRKKALGVPAAMLALCRLHHDECHRRPSVVRDLAVKWRAKDGTYDRVAVNRLRGRQPEAITQAEVEAAAKQLKEDLA